MKCTHINQAKTQISILINSGAIYKEEGPYLAPEEVKTFMEGRWSNPTVDEVRFVSKKIRVIDEKALKEKLEDINKLLSQCECFSDAEEKWKEELDEKSEEVNDKQLILSSIKSNNEQLRGKLIDYQKLSVEEKLKSKKKELKNFTEYRIEGKNECESQILELEDLYNLLAIHDKDNNKVEAVKTRREVTKSKGELSKKGLGINDVREVSEICEEMAKLKLELEEKEQKQQQYEAKMEVPTNY